MTASGGIHKAVRALCAGVVLAACSAHAPAKPVGPAPALPEPRRAARFTPKPEWYWESVEADVRAPAKPIDLPVPETSLVRLEGATRVWEELGAEGRDRLRRDGLVVLGAMEPPPVQPHSPRLQMGAFYTNERQQRVPYLVTLDALAYAMHLAFDRALAEVDDAVLAPELVSFIGKLDTRLGAELKGAGVEVGQALELARAIVAVARGLASDGAASSLPQAELSPAIATEIARVIAHGGSSSSALLGVPIDYARFAVPPGAARPGAYRALAWLASAPLVLAARSETRGAVVGVGTSRLHARTAMLLARVSERDVDPAIHASWSRISRLLSFVWGPPDDLSPPELAELGSSIAVNVEDPKHVANVISVDRLRRRAAAGRAPRVFDGAGAPGRAGTSMRLFGGHAPADSIALASFARAHESGMPQALDLAVWAEAPEARASLHDGGGDFLAGYGEVLARAREALPPEDSPSRHESVHGSQLDVVMTWLAPRDETSRPLGSNAARRAAIESALAAWTYARHEAQPLSRPRPPKAARPARELEVAGAALPAFVEAAPDVVARMLATAGQMKRGLAALGALPPASPAMTTLAEVEDILRLALRAATQSANDEVLAAEDVAALASLPARLAGLEDAADDAPAPMVPVIAQVFVDASGHRVLSTATGVIEPAVTIVREPGTGRLVMAVGAHVAHHELVEARGHHTTEPLTGGARAPYTAAFRLVR